MTKTTRAVTMAALALISGALPCSGQNIMMFMNATGGLALMGMNTLPYGNLNGLALGTPTTGLTATSVSGGTLYTTPLNIMIGGAGMGNPAVVYAYLSTNFTHTSTFTAYICYPSASCSSASSYVPISSTSGTSGTAVIPSPGISMNQTVVANIGIFVSSTSGSGAYGGADSAVITFEVYNGMMLMMMPMNKTLTLSATSQEALELSLASAAGGLTISPASDYSMNYGNVDGVGISVPTGTTIVSQSGGVVYSTPYYLEPVFAGFTSSTGTLKAYVSTNFTHSAMLQMEDSATQTGSYTAFSTSSGSQTTMTTSASSGSTITRYLGLFVENVNGGSSFTGSDNATLTYTLSVP